MPLSAQTLSERKRARERLKARFDAPVTLPRRVYFVPGWRDEMGDCWSTVEEWIPYVVKNYRTHVSFIQFTAGGGGAVPPWEDFLDFADELAEVVHRDVDGSGEQVDLVAHSMGGLDSAAAIALLDGQPDLTAAPLTCVHTLVTYDSPFLGFAAAENELFEKLVRKDHGDPWVLLQLGAMHEDAKAILRLDAARNAFLGGVAAFWPRGADNYDGLLEVTHRSASFGGAAHFDPAVRDRYRGYRVWSDTTHSGVTHGVTHDVRAIHEMLELLTGAAV